ncbi:MAG: CPBP family intramembrane glutamic endopeptidase, partial [Candidatus Margulisiibacteriota bacterium]
RMLHDDIYHPFVWKVRHFLPRQIHQATFFILPNGRPYGFEETISDAAPYRNLGEWEALSLAQQTAARDWDIDWSQYAPLNTERDQAVNGRTDYAFSFRKRQSLIDPMSIRLVIRVQGNRVTGISPSLHLPEAFEAHYVGLRSTNDLISGLGLGLAFLLYGVGGLGIGLWYLRVLRVTHWKPALVVAGVLSAVMVAEMLNSWPLQWYFYETTQSVVQFYLGFVSDLVVSGLFWMALFSLSFAAGEGVTRVAFPHFISFWKLFRRDVANTVPVAGQTAGGYITAMVHLAYVVVFYVIATRLLGWWVPAELDINPNVLATYIPAFSALAGALQAGIWEEVVFRAIPIGGAALLGRRFGFSRVAIGLAWVLQAVVFAACHANYPGFPGYSRLIELMIPALLLGALYIRFGLLPAIVAHTTYDLVLMSLPLLMLSSAWGWVNKGLIAIFLLTPIIVLAALRWRTGHWQFLTLGVLNAADTLPAPPQNKKPITVTMGDEPISKKWVYGGVIAGILGIALWIGGSPRQADAPLVPFTQKQAIQMAKNTLPNLGITPDDSWRVFPYWNADQEVEDDFIWQTTSPAIYRSLIGRGLEGPHWEVAFKRFAVPTADRQESLFVTIGAKGVTSFYYHLPENREGLHLSAMDAMTRVRRYLEQAGLAKNLRQVGMDSQHFPGRTDWTLTFADRTVKLPWQAQRRLEVKVSGDTIVRQLWTIDLPQKWQRNEESRRHFQDLARTYGILALVIGTVGLWLILLKRQNRPRTKAFLLAALAIGATGLVAVFSEWPQELAAFSPLR